MDNVSYGTKICIGEDYYSDFREHTYDANGTYQISLHTVTSDGCMATLTREVEITTIPETEDPVTGLEEELRQASPLRVYPNPSKDQL